MSNTIAFFDCLQVFQCEKANIEVKFHHDSDFITTFSFPNIKENWKRDTSRHVNQKKNIFCQSQSLIPNSNEISQKAWRTTEILGITRAKSVLATTWKGLWQWEWQCLGIHRICFFFQKQNRFLENIFFFGIYSWFLKNSICFFDPNLCCCHWGCHPPFLSCRNQRCHVRNTSAYVGNVLFTPSTVPGSL